VNALPKRWCAGAANRLKTVSLGNPIENFKVYIGANNIDVRKLGIIFEKLRQHKERLGKASIEAASPRQRSAPRDLDGDLLIPKMQIDDAVTLATERAVSQKNIFRESAELRPEYTVGRGAILEHAGLPLQAAIKSKNQLRPKRARSNGQSPDDARHQDNPENA